MTDGSGERRAKRVGVRVRQNKLTLLIDKSQHQAVELGPIGAFGLLRAVLLRPSVRRTGGKEGKVRRDLIRAIPQPARLNIASDDERPGERLCMILHIQLQVCPSHACIQRIRIRVLPDPLERRIGNLCREARDFRFDERRDETTL